MDIGTVVGIVLALGLIISAIGGAIASFIDVPSMLIVIGGTFASVLVNFPLGVALSLHKVFMNALFTK